MLDVRKAAALIAAAVALQGCRQARGGARQDSINRAQPGYVVDSMLPLDEELRRFRAAIGGSRVSALRGGSESREALVRRAVAALSSADTADLRAMTLDAHEFVDLVFPTSPFARQPYRQPVGFAWQQIRGSSTVGMRRLVRTMSGQTWRYVDHRCAPRAEHQGANTIWSSCMVRLLAPSGDTIPAQLFGSIIERDGRFKLVSFR
jgi:hypothetical protein